MRLDGTAPRDVAVPHGRPDFMTLDTPERDAPVRVAPVMADIEARVRERVRASMLAHGASPAYADRRVFAAVDRALGAAGDAGDARGSFLARLLQEDETWRPDAPMRITSHRLVVGPVLIFLKRRLLFPIVRWLHEYTSERFRRQQLVNEALFRAVEAVAIENALLQQRIEKLEASPPR